MAKIKTIEAMSIVARRGLKSPLTLTAQEIKRVCASALAQDETARKVAALQERIAQHREMSEALHGEPL